MTAEKHPPIRPGLGEIAKRIAIAELVDIAGTLNYFETDEALGTTPTLSLTFDPPAKFLKILTVKCMFNPTAGETPELYLFENASDDDVQEICDIVFDSGAGLVDSVPYIWKDGACMLPAYAELEEPGTIYYKLDWTGAPGNTPGYLRIIAEILGGKVV